MNQEYLNTLIQIENLEMNYREVDPEFQDVVFLEIQAAKEKRDSFIREAREEKRLWTF